MNPLGSPKQADSTVNNLKKNNKVKSNDVMWWGKHKPFVPSQQTWDYNVHTNQNLGANKNQR